MINTSRYFSKGDLFYKTNSRSVIMNDIIHEICIHKIINRYHLPTIVKHFGAVNFRNVTYSVQEYISNKKYNIIKGKDLTHEDICKITEIVLYTVLDLNRKVGFVHGDLQCHNMFFIRLENSITIRLCDKDITTNILPLIYDFECSYVHNIFPPCYEGDEWVTCILNDLKLFLKNVNIDVMNKLAEMKKDVEQVKVGSTTQYVNGSITTDELEELLEYQRDLIK